MKILITGTGAASTESTSETENKRATMYTNPTMPTMLTPPTTAIGARRPASWASSQRCVAASCTRRAGFW